jgi:hypothetical protein
MDEEEPQLQPAWERFYLQRVEMYLIHKYQPELVDTLKLTFIRARLRREGFVGRSEVIMTKDDFADRLRDDLQTYVPWKPKKGSHKRDALERPGIGADYQRDFNNL